MRLTKSHKDAFVKAVLDDVPSIDYNEQVRALILDDSISQLPKELQSFARDPKTTELINSQWKTIEKPRDKEGRWVGSIGCTIKGASSEDYKPSKKAQAQLDKWLPALVEQSNARLKLERDLYNTILAFSTVKQAQEAFPEFVKYLPVIVKKGELLPSTINKNILIELARAGFPKGKKGVKNA